LYVWTISLRIDRRSPDYPTLRVEPEIVKDLVMESSDLFSHPYEPEIAPNTGHSSDPVQPPTFSDRPQSDKTADTPPTA